ncbi:MAG: hypothetical protein ACE5IJ_12295 [Thermoplasmata archaeon]
MSEDTSPEDEEALRVFLERPDEVEAEIEGTLQESAAPESLRFTEHPPRIQKTLLEQRDRYLSTVYAATFAISDLLEKSEGIPTRLLEWLRRSVRRLLSVITKFSRLFKLQFIRITFSLTPSIVVQLEPEDGATS